MLAGRLAETDAAAYLSGILIGHEVRAALAGRQGVVVHVIGAPELTALYARAISALWRISPSGTTARRRRAAWR